MELGHIIAVGGGGFGRNPKHNKIEKYILSQANKEKPNIVVETYRYMVFQFLLSGYIILILIN